MDGVLLINKGKGLTSHDVVARVRKLLDTRKVGHAGTLDPNAEGLLVLLVGKATKCSELLLRKQKTYRAQLLLGKKTDTYDIWGRTVEEKEPKKHDIAEITEILTGFLGTSRQTPPLYSALKVDGRKLYQYARAQKPVTIQERTVNIEEMILNTYRDDMIDFTVSCDAGVYIRSLCVDIAAKLGELGTMNALLRLKSGDFTLEQANTLEEAEAGRYRLWTLEEALAFYPRIEYEDQKALLNGQKLKIDCRHDSVLITHQGKIMAHYIREEAEIFRCKRGLF